MNSDSSTNSTDTSPSDQSSSSSSSSVPITKNPSTGSQETTDSMTSPNAMLREYSQELYDYTLGLLTKVKKDESKKGQAGKAYLMKRGISDAVVARKSET